MHARCGGPGQGFHAPVRGGQRVHEGVHRLAVRVQVVTVRYQMRVLTDLVQPEHGIQLLCVHFAF